MNIFVLIACFSAAASKPLLQNAPFHFEAFKFRQSKSYPSIEQDAMRYQIFQYNLHTIDTLNAEANTTAIFGVNKFSDLTPAEFKNMYLTYQPDPDRVPLLAATIESEGSFRASGVVSDKDWRTEGAVTAVKDQGQCGSCWAFSAVEQIESNWFLAGHKLAEFSTQQLVACDKKDGGCQGGDTSSAYAFVEKNGGLALSVDYPDTSSAMGKRGRCQKVSVTGGALKGYTKVVPFCEQGQCKQQASQEDKMVQQINDHGPASICLNAAKWQHYKKGVLNAKKCGGSSADQIDHCVQVVGYHGYNAALGAKKSGANGAYWLVRNSWAKDWGVGGYVHIEMGTNACGIANEVTFAQVA